jgi:FtsP/CotA-like multicopper oxidase with cupredoxin domain/plastocyanin
MANIEYWIQLENRPWDASPRNIDRMTGLDMKETTGRDPVDVELTVVGTGATKTRKMFNPLRDQDGNVKDALILRRYRPPSNADGSDAWTVPDDRKVNPWDLNEPDPTDNGTMGTIPGPVIECNVGDSVVVHFRNNDQRGTLAKGVCFDLPFFGRICLPDVKTPIPIENRVHSLHPHGFVFRRTADGAYPLSPADPGQPVAGGPGPDETAAWGQVPGFSGSLKKGDRVPPGGTFIYNWNTIGWPTTAGVWLYHDHSICDMENVELGAIGIIAIHNPADTQQEVDIRVAGEPSTLDPAFLPGGSPNGVPVEIHCTPFPVRDLAALPDDLGGLGLVKGDVHHAHGGAATEVLDVALEAARHGGAMHRHGGAAPEFARLMRRGDQLFELDDKLKFIRRLCLPRYVTPPTKALYLQLFHSLNGVSGMAINGRVYLGNTPTMLAGRETRMRFGVVGMGSDVHTFHIHGHRWILPGPQGNTPGAIQGSPLVQAVTQFEDVRIFGPANSFVFTIDGQSGSFMRAGGPSPDDSLGEWHMHCHFLNHMMMGMMGSLLIVRGGDLAFALPRGVPCAMAGMGGGNGGGTGGTAPMTATVKSTSSCAWRDDASGTPETTIMAGGTVTWQAAGCGDHTVISSGAPSFADLAVVPGSRTFPAVGDYKYFCGIHGGDPVAKTGMWGIVHVVP